MRQQPPLNHLCAFVPVYDMGQQRLSPRRPLLHPQRSQAHARCMLTPCLSMDPHLPVRTPTLVRIHMHVGWAASACILVGPMLKDVCWLGRCSRRCMLKEMHAQRDACSRRRMLRTDPVLARVDVQACAGLWCRAAAAVNGG